MRTRFGLRNSQPTALQCLKQCVDEFPWAEYCLAHGRTSYAEKYRKVRDRFERGGFMELNQCYRNCMKILRQWYKERPNWVGSKRVSYVEGLAVDPTGMFLHSWIDVGGVAYDMTFPRAWMTKYFGVHFEFRWADQSMERVGKYGLFHNWERSEPYLEKYRHTS